ncbi:MAG: NAD(P)/FAD-dependent oxidoreductase [Clostridia bacterium]|nr:NAD(P)/FAD-dependent oxidoreductase [Clostridia bacterium]
MSDIIVVGAGASGLTAAVCAARLGAGVTVLEKNDRIAKKLLATGNGRCNLTNINITPDRYHGENEGFPEEALSSFGAEDSVAFFEGMGLLTRTEEEGKVFPYCGRASAVLDVFRMELEKLGVEIVCGFDVKEVIRRKSVFETVSWDGKHLFSDKVIFAAGGKAAPNLGGGGSGYDILKKLGHKLTELRPSIVQIKTEKEKIAGLKGIKCQAGVSMSGKTCTGELLFTDYGISGPPAFSLSSYYTPGAEISIDFFPDIDGKRLYMLLKEKSENIINPENLFTGIVHKNIAAAIMKQAGSGIKEIAAVCKNFRLKTEGTLSWNNAQVTAGGIATADVNPGTMESLICPGLYITGEILDVDGDCGGFNLQWAWSSGYFAGTDAAVK